MLRAFSVTNTFAFDILQVTDAATFPPGATLLKVHLDVLATYELVVPAPGVVASGDLDLHMGVFVAAENNPEATQWNPREPRGSFMQRALLWRSMTYVNQTAVGNLNLETPRHAGHAHIETDVVRRLEEEDNLIISYLYSEGGTALASMSVEVTGRYLILLP